MEKSSNLKLDSCTAYHDQENDEIHIYGEVISSSGKPIKKYMEMHAIAFDEDGDIIGREYCNWVVFGIRQSFHQYFLNVENKPQKIKVYPVTRY